MGRPALRIENYSNRRLNVRSILLFLPSSLLPFFPVFISSFPVPPFFSNRRRTRIGKGISSPSPPPPLFPLFLPALYFFLSRDAMSRVKSWSTSSPFAPFLFSFRLVLFFCFSFPSSFSVPFLIFLFYLPAPWVEIRKGRSGEEGRR